MYVYVYVCVLNASFIHLLFTIHASNDVHVPEILIRFQNATFDTYLKMYTAIHILQII